MELKNKKTAGFWSLLFLYPVCFCVTRTVWLASVKRLWILFIRQSSDDMTAAGHLSSSMVEDAPPPSADVGAVPAAAAKGCCVTRFEGAVGAFVFRLRDAERASLAWRSTISSGLVEIVSHRTSGEW